VAKRRQTAAQQRADYEAIVAVGARDLAPDEFWMIDHDEGPLWDTRSKRFDVPVVIICGAAKADWDDLVEAGYRLVKMVKPADLPVSP
jgi:hypothetical protein